MRISTVLSLAGLVTAAPVPEAEAPKFGIAPAGQGFFGAGQIRTLWNQGDHSNLGCLTNTGLWTTNESQCGTFVSKELTTGYSVKTFQLFTSAGPCSIYGAKFYCDKNATPFLFGLWPWPNSIPGVDSLRAGQYGLMATFGSNPPLKEEGPQEIHFVTYKETGKYVWLTWAPLRGGPILTPVPIE
ncbi:Putative protein of unknown function [Podospora comata]|uniref:RNase T2-like C-terminal domain-containing protein n=1 Tax=Podospora comata TaxID=48703 RepID=A0ABY6S358_PODCO|nr:Putative protein of unknown function [Podospora comata]